ncbi:alpha/beta hydrolase [Corynebacterium pelargi]|uniref:Enterochelin esterase n=1 Tax=Corynebacterium pelargi TaxID=1471400 RepID=A0A410WAZ2_9CORY|nr:alpha/beta hydrolase-fold protein [Corynebacterium pelargi]QAU53138.1 Enterochelin esterase [Corynebacterium pelargi]GGG74632.1 enterochelin esterase [Corynebacterium pelargi]
MAETSTHPSSAYRSWLARGFADEDELCALGHKDPKRCEQVIDALVCLGTPLHEQGSNRHTFLFQLPEDTPADQASVHLFLNRITDKDNYAQGVMHHIPGTRWWVRTLILPPSYQGSYGFRTGNGGDGPTRHHAAHGTEGHLLDPHSPRPALAQQGPRGLSHFAGQAAPTPQFFPPVPGAQARCLEGHRLHSGHLFEASAELLGQRPVFLWVPAPVLSTDKPLPTVVLFDADSWFRRFSLADALDAACSAGVLPPCAVIGIGVNDIPDRRRVLGGNDDFAQAVIPWAQQWAQEVLDKQESPHTLARQPLVVAGQSLGGILALRCAQLFPEHIAAAVAQSPSMWWAPGENATPSALGSRVVDWISEQYALAAPKHHPALLLAVGARETPLLPRVLLLSLAAQRAGWPCTVAVEDGGHDYCWWRENLIELLAEALGNNNQHSPGKATLL